MKLFLLTLFLLNNFFLALYSQCPVGFSERNVKCSGVFTKKCIPSDYTCKNCWTIIWPSCKGDWSTGGERSFSTFQSCEQDAINTLNGRLYKTCSENPNEWLDKSQWKIYLDDCGTGTNQTSNLTLAQRLERLKTKINEYLKANFDNSMLGKLKMDVISLQKRLENGDLSASDAEYEISGLENKLEASSFSASSVGATDLKNSHQNLILQTGSIGNMAWVRNSNGSYQITLQNSQNSTPVNYTAGEAEKIINAALTKLNSGQTFYVESHEALRAYSAVSTKQNSINQNGQGSDEDGSIIKDVNSLSQPFAQSENIVTNSIPKDGSFGTVSWIELKDGNYQITVQSGDQSEGRLYTKLEAESIISLIYRKFNGKPFYPSDLNEMEAMLYGSHNDSVGKNKQYSGNSRDFEMPAEFQALETELIRISEKGGKVQETDINSITQIASKIDVNSFDLNKFMQNNQVNTSGADLNYGLQIASRQFSSNYSNQPNSANDYTKLSKPTTYSSGFSSPVSNSLNSMYIGSAAPSVNEVSGSSPSHEKAIQLNQLNQKLQQYVNDGNSNLKQKGLQILSDSYNYTDPSAYIANSVAGLGYLIAGGVQDTKAKELELKLAIEKRAEENRIFNLRNSILSDVAAKWPSAMLNSSVVYIVLIAWNNESFENFDVYTSSAYPLFKSEDGSWPLKDKVLESLYNQVRFVPSKMVAGYFLTDEESYRYVEQLVSKLEHTKISSIKTLDLNPPSKSFEQNTIPSNTSDENFWKE